MEKDWISFGHRFTDRLGDPACPSQRSPVFLQFLECVWQVCVCAVFRPLHTKLKYMQSRLGLFPVHYIFAIVL